MRMQVSTNTALVPSEGTFGLWTGFFFSINTVIGAGFLTLPNVFREAGWLFSTVFMIYSGLQSYFLALQTIEIMSRVEAILRLSDENIKIKRPGIKDILLGKQTGEELLGDNEVEPEIADRRIDISECARVLFGTTAGILYSLMLFLFCLGSLTAYAGIFASSLASQIPLGFNDKCDIYDTHRFGESCYANYWIFLLFYFISMMILMIKGLKEQKWLQTVMCILRFVVITLVALLSISQMIMQKEVDSDEDFSPSMPVPVDFNKAGTAISSILFAFIYQIQFPSIAEFIRDKKRHLMKIAKMVALSCFALYYLVGMITPLGVSNLTGLVTLGFRSYSAGHSQEDRPAWTYIIAYFIVLFPAADIFSTFPIGGNAISDNLLTLTFGASNTRSTPRKALIGFRAFVCSLPMVIAFFEYDLGYIVDWVGVIGYIIVPIAIPLMHVAARLMIPKNSYYDVPYSPRWVSFTISGFSFFLFILNIYYQASKMT